MLRHPNSHRLLVLPVVAATLLLGAGCQGTTGLPPELVLDDVRTLIEAADAFGSITFADAATGQIIALSNGNPQVKVLMPDSSGRIELERSAGPDRVHVTRSARARSHARTLVLDERMGHQRVLSVEPGGDLREIAGFQSRFVYRSCFLDNGDLLAEVSDNFGGNHQLILVAEETPADSLETLPATVQVSLGDKSRSFLIDQPFAQTLAWTCTRDGYLMWDELSGALVHRDPESARSDTVTIITSQYPVRADDRAHWIENAMPGETMRPIRMQAESKLRFPNRFPAVLELLAESDSLVWVKKSDTRTNSEWEVYVVGRRHGRIVLPTSLRIVGLRDGRALLIDSSSADGDRVVSASWRLSDESPG